LRSSPPRWFGSFPAIREQGGILGQQIDLAGKFAAVTGGAQGIGRAIAERLLDSGAAVAIWDRDRALAEATAAELKARGCRRPSPST